MGRVRDHLTNVVHAVTRVLRHLHSDGEHAAADEFIRLLKNIPCKVPGAVSPNVGWVIEALEPDDVVLPERLMIGRNMLDALAQRQRLRFGFQDEAQVRAWSTRMAAASVGRVMTFEQFQSSAVRQVPEPALRVVSVPSRSCFWDPVRQRGSS
ncbi:MAG TPA: hypothetical protein VM223_03430 [Planctomycetota bacterium]|nr:hypothetical protein [Planctomycetota bacterium]